MPDRCTSARSGWSSRSLDNLILQPFAEFREDGITSPGIRLYAAYAAPHDSFPPGQYVVVFLRPRTPDGGPSQTAFALTMSDDGITGINYVIDGNGCPNDATGPTTTTDGTYKGLAILQGEALGGGAARGVTVK